MEQKKGKKALAWLVSAGVVIALTACGGGQEASTVQTGETIASTESEPSIQATEETADSAFLAAMEESILNRMEMSDEESDFATLVNMELFYLESFDGQAFADPELEALAQKYLDGLYTQRDALLETYTYEYQIAWQRGLVSRYEVLEELYENYGFLGENAEFYGTYVAQTEYQRNLLTAYIEIDADLSQQFQDDFPWILEEGGWLCGTVTNHTAHTFSTVFEFSFYDAQGVMFGGNEAYIENIAPGSTYEIAVYVDGEGLDTFTFSNYYLDVRYGGEAE